MAKKPSSDRASLPAVLPGTPTLDDVARTAGVSKSTASRALTGARPVSAELAGRVQAAAERLRYRPHLGARSLRRSETKTIGIVYHSLDNPGQLDLLRGLGAESYERGFSLLVADAFGDDRRYELLVSRLFERRLDGLLLDSPGALPDLLDDYRTANIPVLALYSKHPADDIPVHPGSSEKAVRAAVSRLLSLGHRQFGYVQSVAALPRRAERLQAALHDSGVADAAIEVARIPEPQDDALVCQAVREMVRRDRPVTALFVDHRSTPPVLEELRVLRLGVPRDVSLVSFSESRWGHGYAPWMATITVDVEALGRDLARSLIDWIHGTPPHPDAKPREAVWLERQSVGRPLVPGVLVAAGGGGHDYLTDLRS